MILEIRSVYWPVDKKFDDAITALGKAAGGDNMPPLRYNREQVYERLGDIAEVYQTGFIDEKDFHEAVKDIVGFVLRENAPREPYSEEIYEAAQNVGKAYEAARSKVVCYYRLTDVYDYEAEIERRRQIGLTIDPTIAESKIWSADSNDPYGILDDNYHVGHHGLEYFARNPGAGDDEWVHFHHLPIATRKALWQLDKRLADLDEYHAEVERRQHVGLSIEADTAETACWAADLFSRWACGSPSPDDPPQVLGVPNLSLSSYDPYGLLDKLDEEHQSGTKAIQYFARNPGGTWVEVGDLPEETCDDLLWEAFRDTVEPHTC